MSPDLGATVPPDTRVRLTYSCVWQAIFGSAEPDALIEAINDAWYANGQAVVISPATSPQLGPDLEFGLEHSGATTIDLKTAHQLPTVTWDQWLAPYRAIDPAIYYLGDNAQLVATDYLAGAGTAAAAASATTQARSAAGTAAASDPIAKVFGALNTAAGRAIALGVVLIVLYLLWQFGPQLAALIAGPKRKAA